MDFTGKILGMFGAGNGYKKEDLESVSLTNKYHLLKHPDPRVSSYCKPYESTDPFDFKIAGEIKQLLIPYRAVSLAANQFGIMKRFSVYAIEPDERTMVICFNPRVIEHGHNTEEALEGSLSLPGVSFKVRRWTTITGEYFDGQGKYVRRKMRGWEARIFQHEIDQLDGIYVPILADYLKKQKEKVQ